MKKIKTKKQFNETKEKLRQHLVDLKQPNPTLLTPSERVASYAHFSAQLEALEAVTPLVNKARKETQESGPDDGDSLD